MLGMAGLWCLGYNGFCDLISMGFDFMGFDGFRQVLISVVFYFGGRIDWGG